MGSIPIPAKGKPSITLVARLFSPLTQPRAEPHRNAIHLRQPVRAHQQHHAQRHGHQVRLHARRTQLELADLLHPRQRHQPDLGLLRSDGPLPEGHGHGDQRGARLQQDPPGLQGCRGAGRRAGFEFELELDECRGASE